jgi:tetratricopeptide (TPR) repeat protein
MRALVLAGFLTAAVAGFTAAAETSPPTPTDAPAKAMSAEARALKAARLDDLFAKLKAAPPDGKAIEREIVGEWFVSGDPATDQLMIAAVFAMERRAFEIALGYLDRVVVENPTYVEGWNKRATVYFYMKDYERSLADIEKTLALEPRHFGALAGLGMIMIDLGDKRKAIAAFERALEVDPVLNNGAAVIEGLKAAISKDI